MRVFFQAPWTTSCSCFTCLVVKAGFVEHRTKGTMWCLGWSPSAKFDGTDPIVEAKCRSTAFGIRPPCISSSCFQSENWGKIMAGTEESASTPSTPSPPFIRSVFKLLVPVLDLPKEGRYPKTSTTRTELVQEFGKRQDYS